MKTLTTQELWLEICRNPVYPLHRKSLAYRKDLETRWHHHIPFKNKQVRKVTTKDWRSLILDKRDKGQFGLAKNLTALCGTFYKNAQQHRQFYDLKNPLKGIHIDLPPARRKTVLELHELDKFVSDDPVMNGVFSVLKLTGQRISEVLRMKWENIVDDKWIVGHRGQMKRKDLAHHLPLTAGLREAIEPLQDSGSDFVFYGTRDKRRPVSTSWVYKNLQQIDDRISPHCFRHAFATLTAEAEIDPYGVALVLHHAIPGMTNKIYTHGQQLSKKRAVLEAWEELVK